MRDVPTRRELAEREALIRSRATELLGRPPGGDPEGELARCGSSPSATPRRSRRSRRRSPMAASTPRATVIGTARAFVAGALDGPEDAGPVATEPTGPVITEASAAPVVEIPTVDEEEIAELEAERRAHDRQISEIEQEMARVGDLAAFGCPRTSTTSRPRSTLLFAEYRAGALLDGMLPLVIDGVLDGIGRDVARPHDPAARRRRRHPDRRRLRRSRGPAGHWPTPARRSCAGPNRRPRSEREERCDDRSRTSPPRSSTRTSTPTAATTSRRASTCSRPTRCGTTRWASRRTSATRASARSGTRPARSPSRSCWSRPTSSSARTRRRWCSRSTSTLAGRRRR